MNLRQAAQRALKAMEDGEDRADMIEFSEALIALRAALAEPEQEPYTWRKVTYDQLMEEVRMTQGLFDDAPLIHPDRDKAWEALIKRKDVKLLMKGKEKFKFPVDGSYDLWCICWSKAWDAGFKAGWESHDELEKVKK